MGRITKKDIKTLQMFVSDIIYYAEHDEVLSTPDCKEYTFANVVVSIEESELNDLKKIIDKY